MSGDDRRRAREGAALSISGALSLVLHFAVILPALMTVFIAGGVGPELDPDLEHAIPIPEEEEEERPEVDLGIEESEASTLTWIGYEEYQRHIAQLAAVEQAAMAVDPAGAPPVPPTEPVPPVEEVTDAEPTPEEPEEEVATPAEAPPEMVEETPATPEPPAVAPSPPLVEPTDSGDPVPNLENEEIPDEAAPPRPADEPSDAPDEETPDPQPPADAPAPEPSEPVEPQPPTPPAEPAPPGDAGEEEPTEGDPQDRQSPATSLELPLEDLRTGKPLAAEGLELRPRRPALTVLTTLTASPGNPLVEIAFRGNHRPSLARIISSSGDGRVDNAIKASLYRWRAYGKSIDELEGEETVSVRIKIILNPRAR